MIVKRHNSNGGGNHTPTEIITHVEGEFINDGERIEWAPDFETRIGLSVHYYITPSGVIIEQRPPELIAYHAKGHNTGTIGVGWLLSGVHTYETLIQATKTHWVTDAQCTWGVWLYRHLMKQYGIHSFARHSDIDPKRRWFDPGEGFPWDWLMEQVNG